MKKIIIQEGITNANKVLTQIDSEKGFYSNFQVKKFNSGNIVAKYKDAFGIYYLFVFDAVSNKYTVYTKA